jgi:hypothetical protein
MISRKALLFWLHVVAVTGFVVASLAFVNAMQKITIKRSGSNPTVLEANINGHKSRVTDWAGQVNLLWSARIEGLTVRKFRVERELCLLIWSGEGWATTSYVPCDAPREETQER